MHLQFRMAQRQDCGTILHFIRLLAEYEKLADQVQADEQTLETWLFDRKSAQVLFALDGETVIGFALFFYNFSTFMGRAGVYLEDLFVLPAYRGQGIGRALMRRLARIACDEGCGRFEWQCLDWNTPSIAFYRSLGAQSMDDWTTYRVSGEALTALAEDA